MLRICLHLMALSLGLNFDAQAGSTATLRILFLGDEGHHLPIARYRQLQPVLHSRGIQLSYTDKVGALNPKTLSSYDALLIYANIERITPDQEKALLEYVAGGRGLIALHCASYCFLNSPRYVELVGAQFRRHGTGVFRTEIAAPNHPIMKGHGGFESWDETYVHHRHNDKDRTVLEYREDYGTKEPWTWVRQHGKGRVFYTAWGHDDRTWAHAGFQHLVERGIRWAAGAEAGVVPAFVDQPAMRSIAKDAPPFRYVPATIPYYPPSERWGVVGEPIRKMQEPLSPADSMPHIIHPADFELKLFVAESQLGGKPLCMNWDERGRLWVAITYDYPNALQPEGKGRDRIVICEDTDGDGRADRVSTFADKLSIPTSLTFSRGGVIVQQAPHTLFLRDTNGDGVADERRVLFTGWGTADTHAGPSNLQYGLDNWIWGIVGYSGFVGDIGGTRHSFRQGFYRFKPDGSQCEFVRSTNNNSWGVGISEEGLIFGSTANGCPSVYVAIPNRYYEAVRGWSTSVLASIAFENRYKPITDKVRQVDWHGGFTSAAGHALYTARNYPEAYWNRTAFVSDPTGHLTATFVLQSHGTDFHARYAWNLLASDDEWVAPIAAEVGPDGNVWVIDWYNFIVQHNPTPVGYKTGSGNAYETDLRDKKHGRIYRLVYKNGKTAGPGTLEGASPEALVAALRSDNMFWRRHAQRLLVERGDRTVLPALIEIINDPGVDAIGLNPGIIHALWVLHGLGALDGTHGESLSAALGALKHRSAGVRRNAVLVLPRTAVALEAILQNRLLADENPHVKLAALLAISEMPENPAAGRALLQVLESPEDAADRWLPDALTCAAAAHSLECMRGAVRSTTPLPRKSLAVLGVVAEHYARGTPTETIASLLSELADTKVQNIESIIAGLARGWPKDRRAKLDEKAERALGQLVSRVGTAAKGQLVRLGAALGSTTLASHTESIAASLLAIVSDRSRLEGRRAAAAREFIELRPSDLASAEKLLELVTPQTPPQLVLGIVSAVGQSQAVGLADALLRRLNGWSPAARAEGLRALLATTESTRALLAALDKGQIQLAELTLEQKQMISSHPDADIAEQARKLLARGGALPSPDRQKVIDEHVSLTRTKGNAVTGKGAFVKHCATCHTHSGEGSRIGPDLTGMAVHSKEELLVQILDPNRSVEGNFRTYTVVLRDDRILSGLLSSETRTAVEIIDSQAKKHTVLRQDIDQFQATTRSLMPEGFEKQLTRAELADILEFLTQRGKYLPLPLDKAATIVSTRGMFNSQDAEVERLVFDSWTPKTIEGVPFYLIDPQGSRIPNAILLYGPTGRIPPRMPKRVLVPCNIPAGRIHMLGGVSGWGYPFGEKGSVSLTVRLHYEDGTKEDHPLKNGEHFADYIRRVDVPGSKFAFNLRGRQIRYLAIQPQRTAAIKHIEFVKGTDATAPVIMAVTIEGP